MKEKLQKWLDGLIQKLKQKYITSGRKASGRWGEGLIGKIDENNNGYKITIEGEHYTWQLVHGRRPTSINKRGRLYGIMLKWVKQKGIEVDNPKRFAYFVAKKIDEKGIKVPNEYNKGDLLDDVVTEVESLKKDLKDFYAIDIKSQVIKQFLDGSNAN